MKKRTTEEMRLYQRERRARLKANPPVTPPAIPVTRDEPEPIPETRVVSRETGYVDPVFLKKLKKQGLA